MPHALMTIRAWRTTKRRYADTAFSGEGARLAGGRFNRRGTPLIYTSWSRSLSILEVLAQVVSYEDLLDYVAIPVTFSGRHVKALEIHDLPPDWRRLPASNSTRALGMEWIASQSSLVLRVPSVILPDEHNYLINPTHPDFAQLEVGDQQDLDFDPRLLK